MGPRGAPGDGHIHTFLPTEAHLLYPHTHTPTYTHIPTAIESHHKSADEGAQILMGSLIWAVCSETLLYWRQNEHSDGEEKEQRLGKVSVPQNHQFLFGL